MPYTTDINSHTIGIECRPECTDGDYETLCQLIADIWCDYGVMPVYGHLDFMPTACPGRYYNQLDDIYARAQEIYNEILYGKDQDKPQEDENMAPFTNDEIAYLKHLCANNLSNSPSAWAKEMWENATEKGLTDGTRPQGQATREEVVALIERAIKTE